MLNLFIMSLVQDPSIRELRSVNKECAIIRQRPCEVHVLQLSVSCVHGFLCEFCKQSHYTVNQEISLKCLIVGIRRRSVLYI